jgi:hypothetical protein
MTTTRKTTTRDELVALIDALQVWFAGHTSEHPGWADRERCEADLIARLEMLDEAK